MDSMLYCAKCRGICEDSTAKCPNCSNAKLRQVNDEDFVLLHRADQYTAQRLASQFDEFSVEYRMEEFGRGRVSYLYDSEVMPTDRNIYVKYRDLPTAKGLSAKLGEELEAERAGEEEQFEDMPRRKRILVQVVSVAAFLLLVMLVVFGADALANWFKGLMG